MKSSQKSRFNEYRELNKIGLETFSFDMHNVLDYPIDKLIINLKNEIIKTYAKHDKWIKLEKENPEKFEELNEIAERSGSNLDIQMHEYLEDIFYTEDELYALFEIKIIYAFKHLEINIKKLLSAAYNDRAINKRMNWESISQYLNSKNLNIKNLLGYEEVNQLRLVNNSIKHSDKQNDESILHIPEFKNIDNITHLELEKFYNRIKKSPNDFLNSLTNVIYKDIYEFSEERIANIAESLALRMEKDNATKLSKLLLKYYK